MARLLGRLKRNEPRGTVERATSVLGNARTRFGGGSSDKSAGEASGKALGLGASALAVLVVIALSVWLLRTRAGDETTSETTEPEASGEGVEAERSEEEQG